MGKMFNTIISNDFMFFGLIIILFLILVFFIFILSKKKKNIFIEEYEENSEKKTVETSKEKNNVINKKNDKEIIENNKEIIENKKDTTKDIPKIEKEVLNIKSEFDLKDKNDDFKPFNIKEIVDDDAFSAIEKILNESDNEKELLANNSDNKAKTDFISTKIEETLDKNNISEKTTKEENLEIEKNTIKNLEIETKKTDENKINKPNYLENSEFDIEAILNQSDLDLDVSFNDNSFGFEKHEEASKLADTMVKIEDRNEDKNTRFEKLSKATTKIQDTINETEEKPKSEQMQLFDDEIASLETKINEKPKNELEKVLEKMQKNLEEQKDQNVVAMFEQEQEERAIISYQELLEKKEELLSLTNDERFENENTFSIEQDNISQIEETKEEKIDTTIDTFELKEDNNTEKGSGVISNFISPVFGRREARLDYPKVPNFNSVLKTEKTHENELETTMSLEPKAIQAHKDDAFLSALKEFRKNLE